MDVPAINHDPRRAQRATGSPFEPLSGKLGGVAGHHIIHYVSLTSTMDEAARMAAEGAPEGLVVIADRQTAGRGRHNRRWVSQDGQDILISVLLYPRPGITAQMTVLGALSAAQAVEEVAGVRPSLKWPNDVLVAGKKICGVLTESLQTGTEVSAVIGIGLNVNMGPAEYSERGLSATSLSAVAGRPMSRLNAFSALLRSIDRNYARLVAGDSLVPDWSARLETLGKRVTVTAQSGNPHNRTLSGLATGVDGSGRLLVRDDSGTVWPLAAGEVTLQTPS
jgi:BirA family transcriptional regulator, biotin operon repressor / biotin---[acetyl-CoA-carboxylase] ligase